MATINDPSSPTNILRVGEVAAGVGGALDSTHVTLRGIPSSIGHYRVNHRCALVASQAANSRLFAVRNTHATNLIIPISLKVGWLQTAAHTAAIEDSLDVYKCTAFTVIDTTNIVTPVASVKRTAGMTAAPGNAALRGLTVAGASAGMTGGTLTKDGGSIGQLPQWLLLALPTAGTVIPITADLLARLADEVPFAFVQNEGLILENRVLLGAAAGSTVYIDFAWAEVTAY